MMKLLVNSKEKLAIFGEGHCRNLIKLNEGKSTSKEM